MRMNHADKEQKNEELALLSRWRLKVFWVCLIGYIGYYLCRQNLSAAYPLLSDVFGFSNSELGLIAFYSELAYALGKIINGPLADKWGGRNIFLLGMLGTIGSNILFTFGSSLVYFILIWCLCRYFLSMGWGGIVKMIGQRYESERYGTIMGIISLNFQFGGVIATMLAGFLIAIGVSWQGVFYYPAIILTIIFILSFLFSREKPQDIIAKTDFGQSRIKKNKTIITNQSRHSTIENLKFLIQINLFRHVLCFSFITTFLRSIFFFWTPKFLVDIGLATSNAIFMSAIFPLLGGAGTIFLGWYTDHYAKNGDRARAMWIMLLGLVFAIFMLLLILSGELNSDRSLIITILLGIAGFCLLGPYSMSSGCLLLDIAGAERAGTGSGMIDSLGYVGGAIAVWGAGKLSDLFGWQEVFFIIGIASLMATFSAYMMSRSLQKNSVN